MNGNPCTHNGCGKPTWRQRETTMAWSEVCCSGHRSYIFKNDRGQFETAAERMKRMERVCTCPKCQVEHIRYDELQKKVIKCDKCVEEANSIYMKKKSQKDYATRRARREAGEDIPDLNPFRAFYFRGRGA